jgi:hypothetical protein
MLPCFMKTFVLNGWYDPYLDEEPIFGLRKLHAHMDGNDELFRIPDISF